MAPSKIGPFVLVAIVIVGCLAAGVWLSISDRPAPSLVISVLLACAAAALLYSILGGVGEGGFALGPIKMGGSAGPCSLAAPICSTYCWSRSSRPFAMRARARIRSPFPSSSTNTWSRRKGGSPSTAKPVSRAPCASRIPPASSSPDGYGRRIGRAWNSGSASASATTITSCSATAAEAGLGYVNHEHLKDILGLLGDLEPGATHGPRRLYLAREGELSSDNPRTWGLDACVRNMLPMRITVQRFYESAALYDVRPCDSADVVTSSLAPGHADLHRLVIDGRQRTFVVAVVSADHQTSPFWSSFLVIEMVERRV